MAAKKTVKKATTANPFVEQAEKDAPKVEGKACQTCKSPRVASITGKSVDLNNVQIGAKEHDGYVPTDMGIGDTGYGDYVEFAWCLDCGQIQGRWPRAKTKIEKGRPV